MTLRDDLQRELTAAMARRDRAVASALRNALAAIANAEAVPVAHPANQAAGRSTDDWPCDGHASDDPVAAPARPSACPEHVAGATAGLATTEVERLELTEARQRELVAAELAQLRAHAERLTSLCRRDEANDARRAARALEGTLAAATPCGTHRTD